MYQLAKFWLEEQRRSGNKPVIYALISLGGIQPPGAIAAWSVSRGNVKKFQDNADGKWQLVKLEAIE